MVFFLKKEKKNYLWDVAYLFILQIISIIFYKKQETFKILQMFT